MSGTMDGPSFVDKPVFTLDAEASAREIGQAAINAMTASRHDLPTPRRDDYAKLERESPLLKAAGVKSWSTFYKGTKFISVTERSGVAVLDIWKNVRNGFDPLPDAPHLEGPLEDPEQLGRRILEGLDIAE